VGFGLLSLARPRGGLFVLGEALALGFLGRLWVLTAGGPLSQPLYEPLAGIQLAYRVDHLGLFFAITGIGIGTLQALPWITRPRARTGRGPAWILLAQFGMVTAVLAGELESMAAGWSLAVATLVLLVLLQRRLEPPLSMDGPASRFVAIQASAALLLLAGAVAAETGAGTGAFDSIPVSAFNIRVYVLLAAAPVVALVTLDLLCRALRRPLVAALAASTVVIPMSACVLFRLYDLGGGRLPDARLNALLVLVGGMTVLGFSASSLWAVDLGAAVVRLAQAAAGYSLAAAGAGTALGLTVLALAPLSLGLGLSALLALVEAGHGRLPWAPRGGWRPVVVAAVLLALAWAGGLPVGPELMLRLATLRSGLDSATSVAATVPAAMVPAALALPLMVFAAYRCVRFMDGAPATGPSRARLILLGLALAASGFAALVLAPTATGLAAVALNVPTAEVQSSLGTVPPGVTATAVISVALLVAALALGLWAPRDVADGWPGAREALPPRLAVAPGVYAIRLSALGRRRIDRGLAAARLHPVITGVILWTLAVAATATILR
jgi:hypothetical protein